MAKRKRTTTLKSIERKIKEKRGQGHLSEYKPWLTIHDVPSTGLVSRIKGWKTNRIHHLFSEHYETAYFYTCEWSDTVIDIREQFPLLPLEKTLYIANTINIRHPRHPKTKHPVVITTDFMLTVMTDRGLEFWAHTTKPKKKMSKRTIEKFEIERRFFEDEGIGWRLISENNLDYNLVKNIAWIHSAKTLIGMPLLNEQIINKVEPILHRSLQNRSRCCAQIAAECDELFNLPIGSCLFIVRYLIANKRWRVDMKRIIRPDIEPLYFL